MKFFKKKKAILFVVVLILCIVIISGCTADPTAGETPEESGDGPLAALLGSRSQSLQLVGLLTILSLAPSILIMMSGFIRIVIVLSFTRNAMGLQQMPPNQVIIVLALFLTFFVMAPVFNTIKTDAIDPYIAGTIDYDQAKEAAEVPIRDFMLRNTKKSDMNMFIGFSQRGQEGVEPITSMDDVPMSTIIPAFLTSEIKTAFTIGFFIYIPFIVVDMVVASTLMAMGMMMLPPIVISLPFKVLLFILIDGWDLTMGVLVTGFHM